ncbi:LysM peptidoglycan-binding domain-containing protein [Halopseudomonas oceani]|uniref:lytic transglycosylase n=1 Tax=Halopseudomonas oceani TaxID=1708783 RepID=UPI002AA803A9|nr:LysM peptidoglycan-binding domain-containing protein [Halopseudomonas oceani]
MRRVVSAILPRVLSAASLGGLLLIAGCQTTEISGQRQGDADYSVASTPKVPSPFLTPSVEPAPPELVPETKPHTLWGRIRAGFRLDPAAIDNPRIDQQRIVFASQSRYFELTSARAQRYLFYVVEQLESRDMPQELALLPFIESAYNPQAISSAQAAGLWQFIPSTGRNFSLRQDWWYDGRRDVTASTQAALDYLSLLNEYFDGDWLLALAAYNCGEGCVGRAIKRNEALGLPTDYWNLQLPRETMNYVPKLLALAQIVDSPTAYGTVLPSLANEPYFAEVTLDQQIDLRKVAELADVSTDELLSLNPAFNQRVTAPNAEYQLLIPVDRLDQFTEALAELPADQRINYQHYRVRSGDTLSQIARRHQLTVSAIRDVNDINGSLLRVGQTLMLPQFSDAPASTSTEQAIASSNQRSYRVQAGDNLWNIARAHGTTVDRIKRDNNLQSNALTVGHTLMLASNAASQRNDAGNDGRRVAYTVKSGDSLYTIAQRFNVQVEKIRDWNQVGRYLQPGQQLTLFVR